jgi:hypothetical protein
MSKKSLKITIDDLTPEEYIDVAYKVTKVTKKIAPNSRLSILGSEPEVFEGKNNKQIKQSKDK